MSIPRLVLGTAQFGLPYGVTNRVGQPSIEECATMLSAAVPTIGWLDTSINYGSALDRLGELAETQNFRIVTKINGQRPDDVERELDETLRLLHRTSVDVVLFHDPKLFMDADRAKASVAALTKAKGQGKISRIGASLYDADDVERCLCAFSPDVIQLPASAADSRLSRNGTLVRLEQQGIAIHIRSVFLQGLLLQAVESLPTNFDRLAPLLTTLDTIARRHGVGRQAVCLAAAMTLPAVEAIVCGVTTRDELDLLVGAYDEAKSIAGSNTDFTSVLQGFDLNTSILDPRLWTK